MNVKRISVSSETSDTIRVLPARCVKLHSPGAVGARCSNANLLSELLAFFFLLPSQLSHVSAAPR